MKYQAFARLSLALALGGGFSSPPQAQAADLPLPNQADVEAPASPDWSGFYVGGFGGGSFGDSGQGYSVSSTYLSANLPSLLPYVDGLGSQGLGLRGADLGFDAGYDWKIAKSFVVGVAGDVGWSDLNGGRTTSGTLPLVLIPYAITQQLRADWLGSVRLRAGMTPLDNLLVYATGGPAFGHFAYSASFWDSLAPTFLPGNETENASFNAIRMGWTLGAGAEWALNRTWSIGGEFRHSEYEAVSGTGVLPLQQPTSTAYIDHSSGTIKVNSLQIGVGYHFN